MICDIRLRNSVLGNLRPLLLAAALLAPALPASAGWLKICNRGSADLGLAMAKGHLGIFQSIRQSVEGFYSIPAGRCESFYDEPNSIYALAFVSRDSDHRWASVEFAFHGGYHWNGAARALCGPMIDAGADAFSYMANSSMRALGTVCRGATPMAYAVSGTFRFGDGDGEANVGLSQSDADQVAAAFYSDRDPEAAAKAEAARREEKALQLRLALRAARAAQDAREKAAAQAAAKTKREQDLRDAMAARLAANAVSETPEIELLFSLYNCPQSAPRSAVFYLYIPDGLGGYRRKEINHMPSLKTSTGHRERYTIPRDEDGESVVYWSADIAASVHPSGDVNTFPISGDTLISVRGLGELEVHRVALTPNVLGVIAAPCDPHRLLKEQKSLQAMFTTVDSVLLAEFAADVALAGEARDLRSNHIFANVLNWQFDPVTGSDRGDVLAGLAELPKVEIGEDNADIWILRAPAPYLSEYELLYVYRPFRSNPLALPVIRPSDDDAPLLPLNGTNENLYSGVIQSKGDGALTLTEDASRIYTWHFFTMVEGAHGRQLPVRSIEDVAPYLASNQRDRARAEIAACLNGTAPAGALRQAFQFKSELICSTVRIDANGFFALSDHSVIMDGLRGNRAKIEITPKIAKN